MKHTKENLIKLLKAKCLYYRKVEDFARSKRNYETVEKWQKLRWHTEEIIELMENVNTFKHECDFYSEDLETVLNKGL